jgi:ParB family transcriptional regulator, chromosome partitioning protein
MKRKALGKGLRSLIPEAPPKWAPETSAAPGAAGAADGLRQVDLDRIRPNRQQPRQDFDEAGLEALARSLKEEGVLQPVVVRPLADGGFELVAGERRWRAALRAGLLRIPAVVREVPDDRLLEVALIENLQREALNAIEEAQAFRTLIDDLGLTQQEVAERVGRRRSTIANALRLLALPPAVQDLVRAGVLSAGHARAVAALERAPDQIALAERAVREGLSVRQVETIAARALRETAARPKAAHRRDPNVVAAEEKLQRAVGTKVRIVQGKKGGRVELHYYGGEELDRIFQLLIQAGRDRR